MGFEPTRPRLKRPVLSLVSFERRMLPPGLEPGSRTDLVLTGYKPAALPIELRERDGPGRNRTCFPGLRDRHFASKASGPNAPGRNRTRIANLRRVAP